MRVGSVVDIPGYLGVAAAVLRQAAEDWRMYRSQTECPGCGWRGVVVARMFRRCPACGARELRKVWGYPYRQDVEEFLDGDWFETLCDVLGVSPGKVASAIRGGGCRAGRSRDHVQREGTALARAGAGCAGRS